jgi:D-alanyl-D-alanine dipeptidase
MTGLKDIFFENNVKISFNISSSLLYLRKSVANSLLQAAEYFQLLGYTLRLESAYRTVSHQKQLFQRRYTLIKSEYPDYSHQKLIEMANTYTAGVPILAAHTAGAAVDVLLQNTDGLLINFGAPYPHGGIESTTDYPKLSKEARQNRQTLKDGMEKFGFINYPFEYWHYSIGDVCAAYLSGQKSSIYMPLDYDPITGKTTVLSEAETKTPFKI